MMERGVQWAERQGPGARSVVGGPQRRERVREQQGTGPRAIFLGEVDGTSTRLPGSMLPGVRPLGQRVCTRSAAHGEPGRDTEDTTGYSFSWQCDIATIPTHRLLLYFAKVSTHGVRNFCETILQRRKLQKLWPVLPPVLRWLCSLSLPHLV